MKKAVVLVSGGMDSAVVLALAREQGFACHALSVSYGQRHTSAIGKGDLTVISSGICLSGRARDFDLQSLVGVMDGQWE